MARLTAENVQRAQELMALYPHPRSALIPILHIVQEQDGYLTADGMAHVAELLDLTPAEVYGTASFYDMLFTEPVGRHLLAICTNIACLLNGGYELLEHAERSLGVAPGGTTADGQFTLEEAECLALCGEAPCLTVNWRYFGSLTPASFDELVSDLRSGRLADVVPPHGTLNRVRRTTGLVAGVPREGRIAPPKTDATPAAGAGPAPADKGGRGEREAAGASSVQTAAREGARIESPPGSDTAGTAGDSRHQKGGDTA